MPAPPLVAEAESVHRDAPATLVGGERIGSRCTLPAPHRGRPSWWALDPRSAFGFEELDDVAGGPVVASRVDPRIERTKVAVLTAALQVLGRVGYAAFTMEAVAEEARVARSTLYRHWSDKIDLVAEALDTLNVQPRPPHDPTEPSGSAREQVERLMVHLIEAMGSSTLSDCMPSLIEAAQRHPEVADFLHTYSATRRATLVRLLRAGVDSGEFPQHLDPELASLALAGAVFYSRALTPVAFPAEQAAALVTQVLGPPPAS